MEEEVPEPIKRESRLKSITTNLPLISIIISTIGIIKQFIYYSNFHLPIKYYMGFSEFGMVVSDDLLLTFITTIAFTLLFLSTNNPLAGSVEEENMNLKNLNYKK
jgi:hypothetical protein